VSKITKLVIAGDSIQSLLKTDKENKNKFGHEVATYDSAPLRLLDTLLFQLGSALPIALLPGGKDPVNSFLPQQPLHPCLFPKTGSLSTLECLTNPTYIGGGPLEVLGTSGQNVEDLYRFVEDKERLRMAERTLKWSHLAPTAPDTLGGSFWNGEFGERHIY
jgi:DNA polymerase delta subunit 2